MKERGPSQAPAEDENPAARPAPIKAAPARGLAAAAGAVAVGAGVAGGELVAALVSPAVSPLTAVGGAVIDVVPSGLKDWAIAVFGTADKLALLAGMVLVIAALGAVAGI